MTASTGVYSPIQSLKTATVVMPSLVGSSGFYLSQVPPATRHEFGHLLGVKAAVGLLEAGLNSRMHGSPFHKALMGEAAATVLGSVATTALDSAIGDRLPSRRAKEQSLTLINAFVTVVGAVGLTLWNKHVSSESAVKGLAGWSKAIGFNLAIGLGEGAVANWFNKRHRPAPAAAVVSSTPPVTVSIHPVRTSVQTG